MSKRPTMPAEVFDRWVKALESGHYEQGKGQLRSGGQPDAPAYRYCCLGVLCKIEGVDLGTAPTEPGHRSSFRTVGDLGGVMEAPLILHEFLTIGRRVRLAELNDGGNSFEYIAAWLREHRDEFVDAQVTHDVPDGIEDELWADDRENWVDYERCDLDGCDERVTCGSPTPSGYVSACSIEHAQKLGGFRGWLGAVS